MLYGPEEKINVVTNYKLDGDGKARPGDAGVTLTRNEMITRLRCGLKSDAGGWLRMNPLDGAGVADANVTAHKVCAYRSWTACRLKCNCPCWLVCPCPLP